MRSWPESDRVLTRRDRPGALLDLADHAVARRSGTWRSSHDGTVLIVPKYGPTGQRLLRLLHIPTEARLRLDALARDAWDLMDGRSVQAVLDALQARHPEERDLAARLGMFVSLLVDRGLIELTPPK